MKSLAIRSVITNIQATILDMKGEAEFTVPRLRESEREKLSCKWLRSINKLKFQHNALDASEYNSSIITNV